jgi:hypothetical protein
MSELALKKEAQTAEDGEAFHTGEAFHLGESYAAKPGAIYAALQAINEEIGAIPKGDWNPQQKFDYRGIERVYNHLHRLFAKHSVFTTSEVLESRDEVRDTKAGGKMYAITLKVAYIFYCATDGSYVQSVAEGQGMDSGDKASAKAMTMAHKTVLSQMFMIPTVDPDSGGPKEDDTTSATDEQMAAIRDHFDAGTLPDKTVAWLEKRDWNLTDEQAANLLAKAKEAK